MNRAERKTEHFGPFLNVPSAAIGRAGFRCDSCRKPVRLFRQAVPTLVPRMVFYACRCGTIVVWEDERQPTQAIWPMLFELLRRSGAGVLIFNGAKETPPGFTGIN
jgi:hypothetical protein